MSGRIKFTDMQLAYSVLELQKNAEGLGHGPITLVGMG